VRPVGASYALTVRLISSSGGEPLVTLQETAASDADFTSATGRLAKRLRERVGESLRSINAAPELPDVTTASLPALRKYTEALQAERRGDYPAAFRLAREATVLDSGFASAIGFVVSMILCGLALLAGLNGLLAGGLTFGLFAIFRAIYGSLGCATPSATQAYLASKTRRSARVTALSALSSSFSLGTIVGPALAPLFVLPLVGLAGPLFAFALIALAVFTAIFFGLPDDTKPRHGRRSGHGAAMSYPSLASSPTGASVIAATSPNSAAPTTWDRRPCRSRRPCATASRPPPARAPPAPCGC
jgi:hypothetical protein